MTALNYNIEIEREDGGDWIAEIVNLPGAIAHGPTKEEAVAKVEALALRVNRFIPVPAKSESLAHQLSLTEAVAQAAVRQP
jgi:predicted RNase H-like HicB family nuclease